MNNNNRNNGCLQGCLILVVVFIVVPYILISRFFSNLSKEAAIQESSREAEKIESSVAREREELEQLESIVVDDDPSNYYIEGKHVVRRSDKKWYISPADYMGLVDNSVKYDESDIILPEQLSTHEDKNVLIFGHIAGYYAEDKFIIPVVSSFRMDMGITGRDFYSEETVDVRFEKSRRAKDLDSVKYVLIYGHYDGHWVENATIVAAYNDSDGGEIYNTLLSNYHDWLLTSAESPSWDDLYRYRDSYEGKMVKLQITVVDVEADNWLTSGSIIAKCNNELICISDIRVKKEPKLRKGDTVTIYGYADGCRTMRSYIDDYYFGLFNKTTDVYDVPDIALVSVNGEF